jgi:hypothetical protein
MEPRNGQDAHSKEVVDYWEQLVALVDEGENEIAFLQTLSAIAARVGAIQARCLASGDRSEQHFAEKHCKPLLDQIDLQFRLISRLVAIRELEMRTTR